MAQKVLIGNTVYEITGGKVLIGGKKYKIVSGKTLINEKVLKIDFGGKVPVKVYIYGDVSPDEGGVVINGTEYLYGFGYVGEVYSGDSIEVKCNLFINNNYQSSVHTFVVPEGITTLTISLNYDEDREEAYADFTY